MRLNFMEKMSLVDKYIKDYSRGEFTFMLMRCISFILFLIVIFWLWEKGNQLYIGMLLTVVFF